MTTPPNPSPISTAISKVRLAVVDHTERGVLLRLESYGEPSLDVDIGDDAPNLAAALLKTWGEWRAKDAPAAHQEALEAIRVFAHTAIRLAAAACEHGANAALAEADGPGELAVELTKATDLVRMAVSGDIDPGTEAILDRLALQETTDD
ncbi:MAG: hypothetical protein JNL68_07760 [Burkholderiales bacterium]|nr:hypothetical protein [Burkholderiales bacterium]